MSQSFTSDGQTIGASSSAIVLPINIQDSFLQDGLIGSPCSPRDSQESSPTPQFKSVNTQALSFLYGPTRISIHDYWKTIPLTRQTFVGKVMPLHLIRCLKSESRSVSCDSLQPHELRSPWNYPAQNTRVGMCSLLQLIFPTQGLNPGLLHCGRVLYQLSHQGSPRILEWVAYPFSSGSSQCRN